MSMRPVCLLVISFFLFSDSVRGPEYPPNAVSGGTVVAELRLASGSVEAVRILSGAEPFLGASREALRAWRLGPEANGPEIVVVHFRQPDMYYLGSPGEEVRCADSEGSLPRPAYVVGPAYPAQGAGQGSVILKTEISEDGTVAGVRVIQGLGALTDASIEAVRQWKFAPAVDADGRKIASRAYAVFVYRFPVILPMVR